MDPFGIYAQYGVFGLVVLVLGVLVIIVFKIEGRLKMVERTNCESSVVCDKRKEDLGKAFDKIEELEKKDVAKAGRFETVENKLDNISESSTRMEVKLDKILDHYLEEGLKK